MPVADESRNVEVPDALRQGPAARPVFDARGARFPRRPDDDGLAGSDLLQIRASYERDGGLRCGRALAK